MLKIGVLALQGAVSEHSQSIEKAQAQPVIVKSKSQLDGLDALILPGGESTTLRKLMQKYDLWQSIRDFNHQGKAILGTCAGMVLLATKIEGGEEGLGLMDYTVCRNGFGRQVDSFEAPIYIEILGEPAFNAVFIRAPWIKEVTNTVEVLATYDKRIVAVKSGNCLATAFHPELTDDGRLLQFFIRHCIA